MKAFVSIVFIFFLSACNSTVHSLKKKDDVNLSHGKGYLLIGVETNRTLKSIEISGPQNIALAHQDLKQKKNYILIDVKAGKYAIDRIRMDNYWRVELDDEKNWEFEIQENKINYVGHIELETEGWWQPYYDVELVNKASFAIEYLENDFARLLASKAIKYAGPGEDNFFNYHTVANRMELGR